MKLEAWAVGITAGSREVPGRKGLWQETMTMMMMMMMKNNGTCSLSIGLFGIKKTCNSSEDQLSFSPFLKRRTKSTRLESEHTEYRPLAQQPNSGLSRITVEVLRSQTDTPQSVELLWTKDRPTAETSTWQHTRIKRDRHSAAHPARFRPSIPASNWPHTCDRRRGQRDRPHFCFVLHTVYFKNVCVCEHFDWAHKK